MCDGCLRLRECSVLSGGTRGYVLLIRRIFSFLLFCVFHIPRQFVPPCASTLRLTCALPQDPVCRLRAYTTRLERAVCHEARRPILRGTPVQRTQSFRVTSLTAPARAQGFKKCAAPAHDPIHRA
jgi:hypothetical protein